jgi:hypothetical protein
MKWKFEPSDFDDNLNKPFVISRIKELTVWEAADIANAKLDAWRREATVVYGLPKSDCYWCATNLTDHSRAGFTHRALLIDIEELPKPECKHEPSFTKERVSALMHNFDDDSEFYRDVTCKHCGAALKAKWEPAE